MSQTFRVVTYDVVMFKILLLLLLILIISTLLLLLLGLLVVGVARSISLFLPVFISVFSSFIFFIFYFSNILIPFLV